MIFSDRFALIFFNVVSKKNKKIKKIKLSDIFIDTRYFKNTKSFKIVLPQSRKQEKICNRKEIEYLNSHFNISQK